ncbi:MAG: hypothetical protein K9J13_00835 [Saprospiraceae bacterium]|nr:hypothetical protein [Saprospiraceae bacterium]
MEQELAVGTRIDHDKYGVGIISYKDLTSYKVIFIRGGEVQFSKSRFEAEVVEEPENADKSNDGLSLKDVERVIADVLDRHGSLQQIVHLGDKWKGGTMSLQPANRDLKPKDIPVETFFHKIVMVRDRLRVLEQNINSNSTLTDEEKVNIQQYITRAYGSLTTFNILFADKEHYFVGAK